MTKVAKIQAGENNSNNGATSANETIQVGKRYRLYGTIENGWITNDEGVRVTQYSKEDVHRRVSRITDEFIIAECGRKFLHEGFQFEKLPNETY